MGDGVRSILYRNDGTGHFTDVTVRAGLAASDSSGIAATGVAAGDVDGDGYPDLVVTDAFGPTRLFRNRRDGTFEEITASSGIVTEGPTRSAALADVNGDGNLDLFVCGTGDYYGQMPDPPFDANDGRRNTLFLGDGKGHFRDVSDEWGVAKPTRWSLSCLFADFDGDGRPDLIVTNDFGLKNLYRNVDGKRFEDVTKKLGAEDRAYGMSAAWGDFDGDGRIDLYTTGTYTQWGFLHEYPGLPVPLPGRIFRPIAISWTEKMCRGNSLLLQTPSGAFEDATARSGAGRAGWNWSAVAADLDDDGNLDLYATNGMWGDGREHDRELEFWWETLAYWDDYIGMKKTFDRKGAGVQGIERDAYFVNRGPGKVPLFIEQAFLDGLDLQTNGRAVVAFDANGDGALDLYVRSVGAPEALFLGSRKNPDAEHFLRLRLKGTRGEDNTDGLGARVMATLPGGRILVRESGYASGYLSTGSPIVHLGLGPATRIEKLVVRWPSGLVQDLGAVTPSTGRSPWTRRAVSGNFVPGERDSISRAALLRRRRDGRRHLGRRDGRPASPPDAGREDPRRREEPGVRLEGRRIDGRDLGLFPDARAEDLRPPLARAASEAGLPLLVPQREGLVPEGSLGDRAHAARPHAFVPARPAEARRARPRPGGAGRGRGLAAREGRGRRAERRRRKHARHREGRRDPRDGPLQMGRGRDGPPGDAREEARGRRSRSSRTRRRRSGCGTGA